MQGRAERLQRKLREREARRRRREDRERQLETQQQRTQEQQQAQESREVAVQQAMEDRRRALAAGRLTPEEDLQQRLQAVAGELNIGVEDLVEAIRVFREQLGGGGRRYEAQEVIDSLRNRIRAGKLPRYGDLEGAVADIIVEQNAVAIQQMRDHLRATKPDAVLAVERGGAFLGGVLSREQSDFPPFYAEPKHVERSPSGKEIVRRTPNLQTRILALIEQGQSRFAIVDFYMGGGFAGELLDMLVEIHTQYPHVEFDVMWMRETRGFERITSRITRRHLEEGVTFTGTVRIVGGRAQFQRRSAGVFLPELKGTADHIPQIRATQFPVDIVLGDDMRTVFDPSSQRPVRIVDRQGRLVQEIPVGTPDPVTGVPLKNTREILIRLMEGVTFP
jgi:adenine/guanine phosphoribosyltransferase-like PRPP-binding protein